MCIFIQHVLAIYESSLTWLTYQPVHCGAWRATCARGGSEGKTITTSL